MKKILYFAMCLGAVAVLGSSCHKKVTATTPGAAAKQLAEHLKNDNYDAFVEAIVFTNPVKPEVKKVVNKAHATALRTVHHPMITERGGVKEVKVVSENVSPDKKTAHVAVANTYNNGAVETVNYNMVNDNEHWKIKVNDNKEVWRADTNDGDHEVLKIREGHERDFVKEKDNGEKHFVKDITKRDGQVEVIKHLENGERHREVIKTLQEGNRDIDKLKMDGDKVVGKDKDEANKEILKEKDHVGKDHDRAKEVIRK